MKKYCRQPSGFKSAYAYARARNTVNDYTTDDFGRLWCTTRPVFVTVIRYDIVMEHCMIINWIILNLKLYVKVWNVVCFFTVSTIVAVFLAILVVVGIEEKHKNNFEISKATKLLETKPDFQRGNNSDGSAWCGRNTRFQHYWPMFYRGLFFIHLSVQLITNQLRLLHTIERFW